jgi:HKD family nuclease
MLAHTEFIILPYASKEGMSILHILVEELRNGGWEAFHGAVAFAKQSGNHATLLDALTTFARRGGTISLTVGADVFGATCRGSEYEAVETLLEKFEPYPAAKLYLYHERRRTFHPKLYLFSNEAEDRALAIVGSSNWTEGGLAENIEANVLVRFDLAQADHRAEFEKVKRTFELFWTDEE